FKTKTKTRGEGVPLTLGFRCCLLSRCAYDEEQGTRRKELGVVDLQDRNTRSNLHLVGLPEGSEKDDPMAHHVYTRLSSDRAKPRVFLFKLLRYTDRELILQAARLHAPVKTSDRAMLSFFPDFFPVTAKRRSAFAPVRKEMREAGIQNFLIYPATLKVILNQGEPKMLYSPEEARNNKYKNNSGE
uniref:L1 transposable element RRM domain-containing protein n=1 Tax=Sinocyclocheilus rhinocerous TaxID=307959 RepID=A0A673M3B3_9TELE